ncbi:MAG: isoprenylcysteine carboxylmethyltransferase family protein [Alphaproteobacteria bacterium]|nr:isoprenylcysteine carboxylmethyltransferase family protein [Alphaproteobacteria bacterium]
MSRPGEFPAPVKPLLKARIRHTRLFFVALLPFIFFSRGMLADDQAAHALMAWTGYLMVIVCVLGRGYCSAFIGGHKNESLIAGGPFSLMRNPLYVFSFIGVTGIGLQSGMVTLALLLTLCFMLYYPGVVAREEAYLLHKFGDAYRDYMQRTPRWLPRWQNWIEPENISTQPRLFRETLRDASVFFAAFPIFELLGTLHQQGVVPVYFRLP